MESERVRELEANGVVAAVTTGARIVAVVGGGVVDVAVAAVPLGVPDDRDGGRVAAGPGVTVSVGPGRGWIEAVVLGRPGGELGLGLGGQAIAPTEEPPVGDLLADELVSGAGTALEAVAGLEPVALAQGVRVGELGGARPPGRGAVLTAFRLGRACERSPLQRRPFLPRTTAKSTSPVTTSSRSTRSCRARLMPGAITVGEKVDLRSRPAR